MIAVPFQFIFTSDWRNSIGGSYIENLFTNIPVKETIDLIIHDIYNNSTLYIYIYIYIYIYVKKGARGTMVIVMGNGHGNTSSNPGRDWLHFT